MSRFLHRSAAPVAVDHNPVAKPEDCMAMARRAQADMLSRAKLPPDRVLKPPIG